MADFKENESGEVAEEGKLLRKMKSEPIFPIGLIGLTGVVLYSAMNLRKRKEKLSLYLIHTRVIAQGTFLSCLTLGLVYTMVQKNMSKLFPEKNK